MRYRKDGDFFGSLSLLDGPAAYQLVGEGNGPPRLLTGSWSKRTISNIGTETLPRLLREAAVENL